VHFGFFWKNQTGGGPLFAATQCCFNAIHLATASPCRCLACMPHCFKIFFPHQTLSSFCSLRLLIFLLLQHIRQAEPSRCYCFCSSLCFAIAATLLCCFVACLPLLLLCCAAVPLFASRQCYCFATCLLLPPVSRSRPCHSKLQPRSSANAGRATPSAPALAAPFSVEPCQSAAVVLRARALQCHLLPPLEQHRATLVTILHAGDLPWGCCCHDSRASDKRQPLKPFFSSEPLLSGEDSLHFPPPAAAPGVFLLRLE
jgi:hypothetical protein